MKIITMLILFMSCVQVMAQLVIKNSDNVEKMRITQTGSMGIGTSTPAANAVELGAGKVLILNGATEHVSNFLTITTTTPTAPRTATFPNASGEVTLLGQSINSAEVEDNTLTAADLQVDVVSRLNNVTNDGGNIDLTAGEGIAITANDAANAITVALNAQVIDIYPSAAYAGQNPITLTKSVVIPPDPPVNVLVTISDPFTLQPGTYLVTFAGTLQLGGAPGNVDPARPTGPGSWVRIYKTDGSGGIGGGIYVGNFVNFMQTSGNPTVATITTPTTYHVRYMLSGDNATGVSFWHGGYIVQFVKIK